MVKNKMFSGEYKFQIVATLCANLIGFSHGAALGWLSPALLILKSDDSPLVSGPLTVDEVSWIGSVLCIGGICGNLLFGIIANSWGRKRALCLLSIPQMGFWLLVIFGNHIYYLYAARVLAGMAGGGTFVSIPLFVTEIASKEIRGILGSFLVLCVNMGTLIGFIIGAHLSYHLFPSILTLLPIAFLLTVIFLPETPQFLLRNKYEEDAKKSLIFYRNIKESNEGAKEKLDFELQQLKELLEGKDNTGHEKLCFKDFLKPDARKAMLLGIGLVSLYILSGCYAIINYTSTVFEASNVNIDPNTSSIIVAANQIVGTYVSTILVDRLGRRILLTTSTFCAAFGFISTGIFVYLSYQLDLSSWNWFPVVGISFGIFSASAGLIPVTFVVLAEILPQKIRPIGSSICNAILNLLGFGMLKAFPILIVVINLYNVMVLCGIICTLGGIYILLCIPETKGKLV